MPFAHSRPVTPPLRVSVKTGEPHPPGKHAVVSTPELLTSPNVETPLL